MEGRKAGLPCFPYDRGTWQHRGPPAPRAPGSGVLAATARVHGRGEQAGGFVGRVGALRPVAAGRAHARPGPRPVRRGTVRPRGTGRAGHRDERRPGHRPRPASSACPGGRPLCRAAAARRSGRLPRIPPGRRPRRLPGPRPARRRGRRRAWANLGPPGWPAPPDARRGGLRPGTPAARHPARAARPVGRVRLVALRLR